MRRPFRPLLSLTLASLLAACASATTASTGAHSPIISAQPAAYDIDAVIRGAGVDPAQLRCNRENRWGASLRDDAKKGADELYAAAAPHLQPNTDGEALKKQLYKTLFWRMVRAVLIEGDNNNLGAFALAGRTYTDDKGQAHPVLVFRSGVTPSPDAEGSCFRSLLAAGGVRHVVNLFDGDIPVADLTEAEAQTARAAGATYRSTNDGTDAGDGGYGPWRELLRSHADDPAARRRAEEGVARLIRDEILRPAGGAHRGNVHIHCGGGMHRSGMIAGVVERCINRTPMDTVEAHYRYHVGWRDPAHPGGAEEGNLRFIREFDCRLLER